ncbi:S41 family peptidase [Sphingopyxis panaciterrae]
MIRAVLSLWLACLALPVWAQPISAADRGQTIDEIARLLEARYVDAGKGQRLAAELRREKRQWKDVADGPTLAKALTDWLRRVSGDGHFAVDYSAKPIPAEGGEEAFLDAEIERYYGAQVNHGVQKIERLDGNIMLIDLRVFPPPALGGDVVSAMMTVAAQGDALIIDLRKNGGGMETVDTIIGQLVPEGSLLSGSFDRPSGKTTTHVSPAPPKGRRFGDTKPVYILTSKRTFSAAEALAYDLQALKRATIVGEVTGGGANPFEYRRVHPHFALSLPEKRSVNPITGTNWQDVGIKPDVAVPADQALETALSLAKEALGKTSHGGQGK